MFSKKAIQWVNLNSRYSCENVVSKYVRSSVNFICLSERCLARSTACCTQQQAEYETTSPWDWNLFQKPLININIVIAQSNSCWWKPAEGAVNCSAVLHVQLPLSLLVYWEGLFLVGLCFYKNRLKLWINLYISRHRGDKEVPQCSLADEGLPHSSRRVQLNHRSWAASGGAT